MSTTSPLKRPSAGGRLGRLLASLRPPARAGPLPVQTGFPTSLADLVVKNHGRLKHPRRRHRPPSSPAPPPVAAAQPSPPPVAQEQRREALTVQNQSAVARRRRKGAAFRIRPEVLAVGGAVALALLVVWSKWLVAAATMASVALVWIESSAAPRRRSETTEVLVLSGRGVVSPIREEAETPRSSCADSDTGSDEVCSIWAAADTAELAGEGDDSNSIAPRRKEKRRSLRKLIAKKLRKNGKRLAKEEDTDTGSPHGGESNRSDAGEAGANAGPVLLVAELALPAPPVDATPPEAVTGKRCREVQGGAFPSAAFVPIILVGLVAGKLPAVVLTVLCAVFLSSVDRVPAS